MKYETNLPAEGSIRGLMVASALALAIPSIALGVIGVLRATMPFWERATMFAVVVLFFGIVVPIWLLRMSISVRVDEDRLVAQLWPLSKTAVEIADIDAVETVRIDPLGEYGGWGVKGSKENRLYGMSGVEGVRVTYGSRTLTILTSDPTKLADAIRQPLPAESSS